MSESEEERARQALVSELGRHFEESPGDEDRRLGRLVEDVLGISSDLQLASVLQRIVDAGARAVDARYGALGVIDERGRFTDLFTVGVSPELRATVGQLPHGHGILGELIRRPGPIRVPDLAADPRSAGFPPGHPVMRSLLGVTVRIRDTVYGNLYTADRRDGLPFSSSDEHLLTALANVAGSAIENAHRHEQLKTAAEELQRRLLPDEPRLGPLQVQARYQPAHGSPRIGGDWYQTIAAPGDAWWIVVGDVMGHGPGSALIMHRMSSMLYALALHHPHAPALIVQSLDRALTHSDSGTMATLVVAELRPRHDGSWHLRWTNAGHPPPLLITPGRRVTYLASGEAQGMMIGVDPTYQQPEESRVLERGSTLLLYTDGLIEDPRRPLTDCLDALADLTESLAGAPLEGLCDGLVASASDRPPRDDIALLALRVP